MNWRLPAALGLVGILILSVFAVHPLVAPRASPDPTAGTAPSPSATAAPLRATAAVPRADPAVRPAAPSISPGATYIYANGSLSNSSAPITVNGATYTLTGAIVGSLVDERNGSTLEATGGNVTTGSAYDGLVATNVSDLTVDGINVSGGTDAIYLAGDSQVTVTSDHLAASEWAVLTSNCFGVTLERIQAPGADGAYLSQVTNAILRSDTFPDSGFAVDIGYSSSVEVSSLVANNSVEGVYAQASTSVNVWASNFTNDELGVYESSVTGTNVSGNELSGTYEGVSVYNSGEVTVDSDTGSNATYGIELNTVSGAVLADDHFLGALDAGALIEGSSNISLQNSDLSGGAETGLEIEDTFDVVASSDVLSGFGTDGLYATGDSNVSLDAMTADNGQLDSTAGFYTSGVSAFVLAGSSATGDLYGFIDASSQGLTLTGDTFDGTGTSPDDVTFDFTDHASLIRDVLAGTPSVDLATYFTQDVSIYATSFSGARSADLGSTGDSGMIAFQNFFHPGNATGVDVDADSDFTATYNYFPGTNAAVGTAFNVTGAEGGLLQNNSITTLRTAFEINSTNGLEILGNNMSRCGQGLAASSNLNLTVALNGFFADQDSFNLSGNLGSWIYHNNFVNDSGWLINTEIPQQIGWDAGYPNGGNFWNNHTTPDQYSGPDQNIPDQDGDGIVDTPVNLSGGEVDRYPLTLPWNGYSIQFTETGLFFGTIWTVDVNGRSYTSGATTIYDWFVDGPGSNGYNYTIPNVPGYLTPTPTNGSGVEERANTIIDVNFPTINFPVTFVETGLPKGTEWGVLVNKGEVRGNTPEIVMSGSNGTYTYLPEQVTPYAVYSPPGSFEIAGLPITILVAYYAPTNTTTSAGLIGSVGVYVAIGVAVVLAIAVIVLLTRRRRPPAPISGWHAGVPEGASRGNGGATAGNTSTGESGPPTGRSS